MASTGHSHACWLSDSQLLLLAALVSSEKGLERGPKGTFLQRLVYSVIAPVLSHTDTVLRFNRADVCFDPSFTATITQTQPVSQCLAEIHVSNNVLTNVPLLDMVAHWQQQYRARVDAQASSTAISPDPHPCNVFRETCLRSSVDTQCASRWFTLRDLLPRMVRLGRARSIFFWLSHWMVFPSLRLCSPDRIVSFLIQHFGGATTSSGGSSGSSTSTSSSIRSGGKTGRAAVTTLNSVTIKSTLKTVWEQCTHWKPTVVNDVSTLTYLYCCCNHAFPKKMTTHKMWDKGTLQQLYHCESSSRQSHVSMTTRVPSLGIHLPNWQWFMQRIHQQQQPVAIPSPVAADTSTSDQQLSAPRAGGGKKTNEAAAAKRQRRFASVDELGGGGSVAEDQETDPRHFAWEYTEVEMFDVQRHIAPPPYDGSAGAEGFSDDDDDDEPTPMDVVTELLGLSPSDFWSDPATTVVVVGPTAVSPNETSASRAPAAAASTNQCHIGRHSSPPMCRLLFEDWTHTWSLHQQNALREAIASRSAPHATDMVYLLVC
jgi:hypothetical protein